MSERADPTKVETLRGLMLRVREDLRAQKLGGDVEDIDTALDIFTCHGPLQDALDARITPGQCRTCGGTGNKDGLRAPDEPSRKDCPACNGEQPVSIVTAEAWEAALSLPIGHDGRGLAEGELRLAATALFGGRVEVAREVGVFTLLPGDDPVAVLMPPGIPEGAGTAPVIHEGDRIALLKEATDE